MKREKWYYSGNTQSKAYPHCTGTTHFRIATWTFPSLAHIDNNQRNVLASQYLTVVQNYFQFARHRFLHCKVNMNIFMSGFIHGGVLIILRSNDEQNDVTMSNSPTSELANSACWILFWTLKSQAFRHDTGGDGGKGDHCHHIVNPNQQTRDSIDVEEGYGAIFITCTRSVNILVRSKYCIFSSASQLLWPFLSVYINRFCYKKTHCFDLNVSSTPSRQKETHSYIIFICNGHTRTPMYRMCTEVYSSLLSCRIFRVLQVLIHISWGWISSEQNCLPFLLPNFKI